MRTVAPHVTYNNVSAVGLESCTVELGHLILKANVMKEKVHTDTIIIVVDSRVHDRDV